MFCLFCVLVDTVFSLPVAACARRQERRARAASRGGRPSAILSLRFGFGAVVRFIVGVDVVQLFCSVLVFSSPIGECVQRQVRRRRAASNDNRPR